ncbi:uncharacterized protein LOC113284407 [Papaver somniferum]|uniref:uncharacterized protein LOC113284407 n=1 Tax=Papaver somniferum TaxID=3469 RepID=UPI000E702850|nr:uncharacterized protein LOC113284407 [Papaver somniferum]
MLEVPDSSRLSVPPQNPPLSTIDMLEPMDLFSNNGGIWSTVYTRRRGFKPSGDDVTYQHLIVFEGDNFTVDGGAEQNTKDPKYHEFFESIKNHRIPEEFAGDGKHKIEVVRGCKSLRETAADFPDENFEEYRKLMMSIKV